MLVHLGRRADLLDLPLVEDGEPVAHRQRLVLVVRHVDERDAEVALQRLEEDLHLLAQLQVERAERLVEEQDRRPVDDRARERDSLALAARELHRLAVAEPGRRTRSSTSSARARRSRRDIPLTRRPYSTFSRHGHVREQRVVLEDRVDCPLRGRDARDVDALQLDAAGVGALEAGDHAQRRRLARARRAEHREELARSRCRGRYPRPRRRRRRRGGCRSGGPRERPRPAPFQARSAPASPSASSSRASPRSSSSSRRGQRRQEPDDVPVEAAREEEQSFLVRGRGRRLRGVGRRLAQLEREHRAEPAHLAHERPPGGDLLESRAQERTDVLGPLREARCRQLVEHGERGRAGDRDCRRTCRRARRRGRRPSAPRDRSLRRAAGRRRASSPRRAGPARRRSCSIAHSVPVRPQPACTSSST